MLNKAIRILNFDNSVVRQERLLRCCQTQIIDLTDLASSVRLYMPPRLRAKISTLLEPETESRPTFLGSGDFHHISELLTSHIDEEACLIVFDFHPDWEMLPPRFGCGSWVNQALKNRNISRCILIGMGSDDLSWPALQTAGLGALSGGRLEIYPYRRKPGRVYFRVVAANPSVIVKKGFFSNSILWHELEKEDMADFTLKLVRRLPVKKAYISIDKDCLKNDFALTNWEEGFLTLKQLLTMLKILRDNLEIIGLDITGEYSPVSG
jgi:arginase family enzyme